MCVGVWGGGVGGGVGGGPIPRPNFPAKILTKFHRPNAQIP